MNKSTVCEIFKNTFFYRTTPDDCLKNCRRRENVTYSFFFSLVIFCTNICIVPILIRRSRPEVSVRKGVFRTFAKFAGKHLYQSLFFNKVTGLRPVTLLKKRLWHRCWSFPVNFVKFLRTPFTEHLRATLLLTNAFTIRMKQEKICRNYLTKIICTIKK